MSLDWCKLESISKEYGDDFFVFNELKLVDNFENLKKAFNDYYPNTKIGYSYKTNYTPHLCKKIHKIGGFAEVVSEMELKLARDIGVEDEKIIYNGPNKSTNSLLSALLSGCIVNIDSTRDYLVVKELANRSKDKEVGISIRCNFEIDEGQISRFGIDVDSTSFREILQDISETSNINLDGLHCHFPDRALDTYAVRTEKMISLIRNVFADKLPKYINIGGGFFSEMPESMWEKFGGKPPSFSDYGKLIGKKFYDFFLNAQSLPILFIEPGTALVADTFKYYCKVVSIKQIRNRKIATVTGSIFTISPTARNSELPVSVINKNSDALAKGNGNSNIYDIAGFTCIEGDYLTKELNCIISEGDFLEYSNVGSYSVVMKPPFILPAPPILGNKGSVDDLFLIKKRERYEDVFCNFIK